MVTRRTPTPFRPLRDTALALVLGCTGLLTGCGGSVSLGWSSSFGDLDDLPPTVQLVVSTPTAAAGQTVRLSATARDDYTVTRVEFYRVEASGAVLGLGSDGFAPYTWDTAMPDSAGSAVRYLARAVDDAGQVTDSAWVGVTVLR